METLDIQVEHSLFDIGRLIWKQVSLFMAGIKPAPIVNLGKKGSHLLTLIKGF